MEHRKRFPRARSLRSATLDRCDTVCASFHVLSALPAARALRLAFSASTCRFPDCTLHFVHLHVSTTRLPSQARARVVHPRYRVDSRCLCLQRSRHAVSSRCSVCFFLLPALDMALAFDIACRRSTPMHIFQLSSMLRCRCLVLILLCTASTWYARHRLSPACMHAICNAESTLLVFRRLCRACRAFQARCAHS
jgi:hypothetical protein